ncbi:MAG TPA: AAA family ATPase [Micavibrio sp.]
MGQNSSLESIITPEISEEAARKLAARIREASALLQRCKAEVRKDIKDQDAVLDLFLTASVGDGHTLVESVPGLAKTTIIKSLAQAIHMSHNRVQFTADLQPVDVTGSAVENRNRKADSDPRWVFQPGPVFTQLLLADEINRAPAKTQSAMLEAMAEGQVSIDGITHKLPRPFIVMATQNPLDQDGTSPLPEAQADRFLMKIIVDYPGAEAEQNIAHSQSSTHIDLDAYFNLKAQYDAAQDPAEKLALKEQLSGMVDKEKRLKAEMVFDDMDLLGMQQIARSISVPKDVAALAIQFVRALRPQENKNIAADVQTGPSPRGEIALMQAMKARVLVTSFEAHGQLQPTKQDLEAVLEPVLSHRLILNHRSKKTAQEIIAQVKNDLKF